jgi:hypothetical protein
MGKKLKHAYSLLKVVKMIRSIRRFFKVMNREEYRENYRLASIAKKVDTLEMPDMLGPDGKPLEGDETVILNAIPELPIKDVHLSDPYLRVLKEFRPDILYLQFDPMPYLARQRYLSYQQALQGDEDYNKKGIYALDNPIPLNWEECVVNLMTLDCMRQNVGYNQLDLTSSLACYSYPTHQPFEITQKLTDPFISAISQHIAAGSLSKYHYINNVLYMALMGKSKVVLGDMPEPLLRLQLGNTLPLTTVREIYSFVVEKLAEHYRNNPEVHMTMEEMTMNYFPHIFQTPRDLYLTAMIKETMRAATTTAVFVGAPHYIPIQRYWVGPPGGVNYTQATNIPPKIPNESPEMLIEKQVLFDLLLDSKVWGQKYISNPFVYITESIVDIPGQDLNHFKKYFKKMIAQYSVTRDKKITVKEIEGK